MDRNLVYNAFQHTTTTADHTEATNYLNKCSSTIGFPLVILECLSDVNVDVATRQAAVIYLKNLISRSWSVSEEDAVNTTPISEQDKVDIRSRIIERIIEAPEPIRVQLCVCVHHILRNDFPYKWISPNGGGVIDEIIRLLKSQDANRNLVAMLITYRLAKIYEYKRNVDKQPFDDGMRKILPLLLDRFTQLLRVNSQESCLLQKMILKIFYCMIQFSLNSQIFTVDLFSQWLNLFVEVLKREIPIAEVERLDDPEDSIYWKCKKWALKIITRVFERYGSKGHVDGTYKEFSESYTKNLLEPVILDILEVLNQRANGVYVTPRVLSLSIGHISEAMCHAHIWKLVKVHVMPLFKNVLFPLLEYTDEDEELWTSDPEEYLQQKADCFEEFRSPTPAAMQLIRAICRRKGVLLEVLPLVFEKFNNPQNFREIDGALNVIAALGEYLCTDKRYKKDVEKLLNMHVKDQLLSTNYFVRARALQVFAQTAEAPFTDRNLLLGLAHRFNEILSDPNEQLPVKFEAAMAMQAFITHQDEFRNALRPHIRSVILNLFHLLEQTNLDDLPSILETVIENFEAEMIPIAEDVVNHLVKALEVMLGVDQEDNTGDDNGGITIMGLMSNLQTILYLIDEREDIVAKVEPAVLRLIVSIFSAYAQDYFEECTGMVENLISVRVSPTMWEVYDKMVEVFKDEGSVFFSDSLSCFHKFIVIDTEAFTSNPERIRKMLWMCETVLNDKDAGNDIRVGAVKMLEVLLLQCPDCLNEQYSHIIILIMEPFVQEEAEYDELHCQIAITLIAAFIYNMNTFVECISSLPPQHQQNFDWFYNRLFCNYDKFNGIHDRIMLIYAFCIGLQLPPQNRPRVLVEQPEATLSVMMKLFEDIKRARAAIAANDSDDSDSDDDSDDASKNNSKRDMDTDLHDSDDDLNEGEREYTLSQLLNDSDSDDDEERHSFVEWTDMEEYSVKAFDGENAQVNIYNEFLTMLEKLEQNDSQFYQSLVNLPADKRTDFSSLIELCRREQEHLRSRATERSGGFAFDVNAEVPNRFNFS
ncbi:D-Importin 7/RanBP7 [Aphelenchoides besseyi]|nr:D-Importin 7/RanBP7 [Aphelenchoides besseyi]